MALTQVGRPFLISRGACGCRDAGLVEITSAALWPLLCAGNLHLGRNLLSYGDGGRRNEHIDKSYMTTTGATGVIVMPSSRSKGVVAWKAIIASGNRELV